jgi:hypothetical protein
MLPGDFGGPCFALPTLPIHFPICVYLCLSVFICVHLWFLSLFLSVVPTHFPHVFSEILVNHPGPGRRRCGS